jgi:hypothetical protein
VRDLRWSASEKAIARKAFRRALDAELADLIRTTKEMAAAIQTPDDVWRLERYLRRRGREIDAKYDYRYSILLFVFRRLWHEGWLQLDDLKGLHQDKLDFLQREF